MPAQSYEPKHIHKMKPGWLFPYLFLGDEQFGTQRWNYWAEALEQQQVPEAPIPPIDFGEQPHRETVKHISDILNDAARYGGIRHSEAFESFAMWLLHGFGDPEFRDCETADQIPYLRLPPQVLDIWYEQFQLGRMQQYPADYMAFFSQGGANKDYNPYEGAGFFATPMSVCKMMAQMTFLGDPQEMKRASMCDPCCGTGSLLLAASNYSLNLYGQDISKHMVRYTRINGWLYAPWMVFWPDLSVWFGPTATELRRLMFEMVPMMQVQPEPEPLYVPVPANIMQGTLKQTDKGQYVLPLFEDLVKA